MAYDFRCKWCGFSEAHHIEGSPGDKLRGYRYTLGECKGYELNKKDASNEFELFKSKGVINSSELVSKLTSSRDNREIESD